MYRVTSGDTFEFQQQVTSPVVDACTAYKETAEIPLVWIPDITSVAAPIQRIERQSQRRGLCRVLQHGGPDQARV